MRELSHENLSPDLRAAIQGQHHGKLFYLWHPDDVGTARPMPERQWFEVYQPLLVRVARTGAGRDLLGIPANFPVIDRVDHNAIHGRIGGGQTLSRFYVGAKFGNRIRYQWPEFKRIAKSIYEHWGPDGLYREPVLNWGGLLVRAAATDTFYPDPDPESTTVDGFAGRTSIVESFATKRAGAGNNSSDTQDYSTCPYNVKNGGSNDYAHMRRAVLLFDTSSLSGSTVSSASMFLYWDARTDTFTDDQFIHICASSPASNTALANSDFNIASWGSTSFGASVEIGSLSLVAYTEIALNASGIAAIDTSGITKMGYRNSDDFTNTEGGGAGNSAQLNVYFADKTGTSNDPYLQVTHGSFVPRTAVII